MKMTEKYEKMESKFPKNLPTVFTLTRAAQTLRFPSQACRLRPFCLSKLVIMILNLSI
jgi:hypothetical protein